jgi:hypothetical protein
LELSGAVNYKNEWRRAADSGATESAEHTEKYEKVCCADFAEIFEISEST